MILANFVPLAGVVWLDWEVFDVLILWMGVVAIAVSHLISFGVNFIGRGEYRRTNLMQLMQRPYGRIIVLHISVIAGGFLVTMLGNPFWMLPVLVVVKTGIDLRMHLAERRIFGIAAR